MTLARPGTSGTTGPFFLDRLGEGGRVGVVGATAWVELADALLTVGS